MKVKEKKYIYLAVVCFLLLVSFIGDDWKTLTKEAAAKRFTTVKNYNNEEKLSMNITYQSYEDHEGKKPVDRRTGYYLKDKQNYFYGLGSVNVIQNKKYKISLDSANKVMIVSDSKDVPSPCASQMDFEKYLKD